MKQNKYIGIMMMAAAMLAATSCTDYSDYNDYPASSVPSADKTLWENIEANPQLSNFKALLQQAGFDEELKSSKAYTVWAPADNTFDMAAYQNLSKEDLLKQFVKSHVAAFAYPASGNVDQRVLALNEKYFTFKGDGAYTFDGRNVTTANVPATNGLMHITDGDAKFYPNIYEYIKASEGLDSLKKYLLKYELTELNTSKSVKGPIVNGIQTYIDSVMETENIITKYRIRAQIDREDSSYLAVLPTDKAFKDMYDKVYAANNFITTTTALDVDKISSYDDTKTTTKVNIRDTKELRDSVAKLTIASNLFFSKNDYYYQMWKDGSAAAAGKSDTIRSTTNAKLSNPKEITEDYTTGQKVNVSNGEVIIVDSLAMKSWETYKPKIKAWLKNNRGLAFSGVAEDITVPDSLYDPNFECTDIENYPELVGKPYAIFGSNPEEKNYSWVHVTPDNEFVCPHLFVKLPEVKSGKYNFYVVYMPTAMKEFGNEPRSSLLNYRLSYCNKSGTVLNYVFGRSYAEALKEGKKLPAVPKTVSIEEAFTHNTAKVDTVFIGQFDFEVSYSGLGISPSIHISSEILPFSLEDIDYSRDIRIAAIIMKPVELDEYEEKNK